MSGPTGEGRNSVSRPIYTGAEVSDSGEYVPTLDEVRTIYVRHRGLHDRRVDWGMRSEQADHSAEFEAALAANNAAVREAAQREVIDYLAAEVEFHDLNDARTHFNLFAVGEVAHSASNQLALAQRYSGEETEVTA